jgi:SSS family solute:Na+ symporter
MQQLITKPSLLIYVVIYVLLMVAVGAYYTKKSKTSDEFVKAGGGLGSIVLMGTFLATYTGNGTISGGGNSLAYNFGIWPGIFFAAPALAGAAILYFLAKKIRDTNTYTVAGIIEQKYGRLAKTLSGAIIALSMISICAYQYKCLAYVLNVTTGMDVKIATILSAAMMLLYSFNLKAEHDAIVSAVDKVLNAGYKTADLAKENTLSTTEMTEKIIENL